MQKVRISPPRLYSYTLLFTIVCLLGHHRRVSEIVELSSGIHTRTRPEIPPETIMKISLVILSGIQFKNR